MRSYWLQSVADEHEISSRDSEVGLHVVRLQWAQIFCLLGLMANLLLTNVRGYTNLPPYDNTHIPQRRESLGAREQEVNLKNKVSCSIPGTPWLQRQLLEARPSTHRICMWTITLLFSHNHKSCIDAVQHSGDMKKRIVNG